MKHWFYDLDDEDMDALFPEEQDEHEPTMWRIDLPYLQALLGFE